MNETTPEGQALLAAFDAAPAFVQEFVNSGKFAAFTERLNEKLPISDEQKAKTADELFMALLGIAPLSELPDSLSTEVGLPDELVAVIIEEAREGMFEPLIAQGGGAPAPDLPLVIGTSARPVSAPSVSPLATFHAEAARAIAPGAAPARPVVPPIAPRAMPPPPRIEAMPSKQPVSPVSRPASNIRESLHARTMASDIEEMEGKGTPPETPMPVQKVPAPTPGPTPPAKDVHADLRQYGIDPYREPIG